MTGSLRKTLTNSLGTIGGGGTPGGNTSVNSGEEARTNVYRPPDYPSALFSRDSAYQYDDECLDGSGTNGSFDAPLSSMLPMSGAVDSSTLVDYYDAFLLNYPDQERPPFHNHSIDTSMTTTSGGDSANYPSHPSVTTDTSTMG